MSLNLQPIITYERYGIIAGNYSQYEHWKHQGYDWGQRTFYVLNRESLRGISKERTLILVIGTGIDKSELIDKITEWGFEVRYQ